MSTEDALNNLRNLISQYGDNLDELVSKNYKFLFGNNYNSNEAFRNQVQDLFRADTNEEYKRYLNKKLSTGYNAIINNNNFDTLEDFIAFENIYNLNKDYNFNFKSSRSEPIQFKQDAFNDLGDRLRFQGKTEHYVINKLRNIQQKAKDFNLPDYNFFGALINQRQDLAREEKEFMHQVHQYDRERHVKMSRMDELESEMSKYSKDSLEYAYLNREWENLRADIYSGTYERTALELPPPREGAPMFEGGAVPSVIADSKDFDNYKINNKNIHNQNKPYTIDDLKIGDNFLDQKGNRYVYRHMSPKNPSMDIHRDMYHFINTATGEEEVFRNKDGILNFLSKTDNVMSVEDAKDLIKARREFDKQSRLYNEMAFDESQMTIEEFNAKKQKYFENKVIPAKEEFDKQNKRFEKKTGQTIELSDREIRAIERLEHDKNYYQEQAKKTIEDELDPYEWDTKYLDVAEFPNGPQDVIDMAHEEALKMNTTFGDTVEETIENTTENVLEETVEAAGETIAKEVIEEGTEKILKEVTGINVELDGLNKKKTPKKLKKGTGKYKAKTSTINNEIYDRLDNSRYWAVDFPGSNGDFAVHGPNGTKRLEKEKIDQQRRRRKYEQTRQKYQNQNQSQNTSTSKNTNNTPEPINADEPVNPINPNDGNDSSANMNGSSGGDGSGGNGNGGDGGNTANLSDDGGSGKKRRKGNSSQADLPKLNMLDVDLPEVPREGGSISKYLKEFSNMGFFDKVQTLGAAAGAVSEYKNARRQGHGVVSSVARAGVDFALGEAMGIYYPLFLLAKEAPGMIVKGSEMLYKENRKMNSMANQQIFGDAQFQDTQQLATMRQSGMEMAKMAQYNLQQTLMGNEATYFHR